MSRKSSFKLAVLACSIFATPFIANSADIYVAGYGGIYERTMSEKIIPAFEAANGAKVHYVAGQSTATLAKVQASRGSGEIDVMIIDDGPMYQAVQYDFCVKLDPAPVYEDVYPIARFDERAVGLNIGVTGLIYNEVAFKEKGWEAPTSWKDLEDPKYKSQVAVLGGSSTTGIHGMVMVGRSNGGGEANIEPTFTAFAERIRPNILTFAPSAPKLEELLQNREISLTVLSQSRAVGLQRAGMPVKFVTPKEGSPVLMTTSCVVKDTDQPELAQKFVQYLLSPEVQKIFSESGNAPVNRKTELTAEQRTEFPSEEQISGLLSLDWPTINKHRADWINRWNREIER